jgi:antitoxin MazE
MQTIIKKWGNSPALRLSAAVMKSAHLNIDQLVSVKVQKGRIVIEPMVKQEYQLNDLLAGITAKNLHGEVDFGNPVGKELI